MRENIKKSFSLTLSAVMMAAILPTSALAADETKTDPNKYVFSFIYGGVNGEHSERSYYIGEKNSWNDYGMNGTEATELKSTYMNITLNDTGYVADSVAAEIRTGDYTGKDWNNTQWGWGGLNIDIMGDYSSSEYLEKVPDKFWGNVLDISEYESKGYAVFKINVTNSEGIDDAYFTITAPINGWAIPGYNDENPLTKENYPSLSQSQHYCTLVSGVKVTDYYDKYLGGEQVVAIPLREFVRYSDFLDTYGKAWNKENSSYTEVTPYTEFNLSLFSGMGIARRISEDADTKPLGFSATVSAMSIINIYSPTNFVATLNEDGSVTSTFDITSDKDVSFKVKRVSDNEVVYFDAPDGTYIDTTRDLSKTYSYSAVSVYDEFVIEAESEENVTIEREVPEVLISDTYMFDYYEYVRGQAWDVIIEGFDSTKSYIATFTDADSGEKTMGRFDFGDMAEICTESAISFAMLLHTKRGYVDFKIDVK